MKKLGKLKLNVLNEQSLEQKQMNELRGGEHCCTCSCYWANNEGSSSGSNRDANYNSPTQSYSNQGSNCYWYCCNDSYDQCGSFYMRSN
jgi:natural product precursor